MKTKPIILLSLAFLSIFSYLIMSGFRQASNLDEGQETVIVSCRLIFGRNTLISIYRGDSKIEATGLDTENRNDLDASFDKSASILNKLNSEGYEVVSSSESMEGSGVFHTYVLKKK